MPPSSVMRDSKAIAAYPHVVHGLNMFSFGISLVAGFTFAPEDGISEPAQSFSLMAIALVAGHSVDNGTKSFVETKQAHDTCIADRAWLLRSQVLYFPCQAHCFACRAENQTKSEIRKLSWDDRHTHPDGTHFQMQLNLFEI